MPQKSKILRIENLFIFFIWSEGLLSYKQFCDIVLIKSCKIYLVPMMPPGGKNWQCIILNWAGLSDSNNK